MLRLALFGLGIMAGAVLPIQAALNARVGHAVGSPIAGGALISFTIGGLALLGVVVAQGTTLHQVAQLRTLPLLTVGLVIIGQLLLALVLDQFGWLGLAPHPLALLRGPGVLLLLGVWLIKTY